MYNLKPFVKWAGGKTQLLDELTSRIPNDKTEYVEPFVGGGALFLNQLDNKQFKKYTVNDFNRHLYNLFNVLKSERVNEFIIELNRLVEQYLKSECQKEFYLQYRDRFNNLEPEEYFIDAKYFLFLNKTCFNGLYRENKNGKFNTPWGGSKKTVGIDYDGMDMFHRVSSIIPITLMCADYNDCKTAINENSFVYIDPPYRPISIDGNFNTYNADGFNDDNQRELKLFCDYINNIGGKFLLSNSDCPDGFFDDLYKDYNIERVYAKRSINSKGNGRGKITELLIKNY